jgi:hypothetical protein
MLASDVDSVKGAIWPATVRKGPTVAPSRHGSTCGSLSAGNLLPLHGNDRTRVSVTNTFLPYLMVACGAHCPQETGTIKTRKMH